MTDKSKQFNAIKSFEEFDLSSITFTSVQANVVGQSKEYTARPKINNGEKEDKKMPNVRFVGPPMYFPRGLFDVNSMKQEGNQPASKKERLTFCARFGNDENILSAFPKDLHSEWLNDCHKFRKFINKDLRGVVCEKFKTSAKDFGISASEAKMFYNYPYELRAACVYNFKPRGSKSEEDHPSEEEALTKTWDMYVQPLDYYDEESKRLSRCIIRDPSGNELTFDQIKGFDVWGIPTFHMQKVRSNSSTRSIMFKIVHLVVFKIQPAKASDGFSQYKKLIDTSKYSKVISQEVFEDQFKHLPTQSELKKKTDMDHEEDDEQHDTEETIVLSPTKKEQQESKSSRSVSDHEDEGNDLKPPVRSNARDIRSMLRK